MRRPPVCLLIVRACALLTAPSSECVPGCCSTCARLVLDSRCFTGVPSEIVCLCVARLVKMHVCVLLAPHLVWRIACGVARRLAWRQTRQRASGVPHCALPAVWRVAWCGALLTWCGALLAVWRVARCGALLAVWRVARCGALLGVAPQNVCLPSALCACPVLCVPQPHVATSSSRSPDPEP